jgi:hypothetical protein
MAMNHNQQSGQGQQGRRHVQRGRRGPDRRTPERRGPQPHAQEQQTSRSDVDVEQIMRDIRSRIAQQQGVELSNQQIQDLAARRLESILDPRSVKPALLDQLRRATGALADAAPARAPQRPYEFEDTTLYESPNGAVRFLRRLLNPILKLFFNPNPLIQALNIQVRVNAEAAARDADRDRRQAEWNALHYEILRRHVAEISRVMLEAQALSLKVESLSAKVDFNERRVRHIEGAAIQARPAPRREVADPLPLPLPAPTPASVQSETGSVSELTTIVQGPAGLPGPAAQDAPRRRRRRRRGRRGASAPGAVVVGTSDSAVSENEGDIDADSEGDPDEGSLTPVQADENDGRAAAALAATATGASPLEPVAEERAGADRAEREHSAPPDGPERIGTEPIDR